MKHLAAALLMCSLLAGCAAQADRPGPAAPTPTRSVAAASASTMPSVLPSPVAMAGRAAAPATSFSPAAAADHNALVSLTTVDSAQQEEPLRPLAHLPAATTIRLHLLSQDAPCAAAVAVFAPGATTLAAGFAPQMLELKPAAEAELHWSRTTEPQPFKLFVAFLVRGGQPHKDMSQLLDKVTRNPQNSQLCAVLYEQMTGWQKHSGGRLAGAPPVSLGGVASHSANVGGGQAPSTETRGAPRHSTSNQVRPPAEGPPAYNWKAQAWTVGFGQSYPGAVLFRYGSL